MILEMDKMSFKEDWSVLIGIFASLDWDKAVILEIKGSMNENLQTNGSVSDDD